MQSYHQKIIFITGGTGTFGQSFLSYCLVNGIVFKKLILFSRDELKHYNLQLLYPKHLFPNIEYKIGDVRDEERLTECMQEADIVIHAAAMKHVHLCEENPTECYKTNVKGAENVIRAFQKSKATQLIAISTDKAVQPTNVYGNSKQDAERIFLEHTNSSKKISIVRYGNVFGASGSVVPTFEFQKKNGVLYITDSEMTRYFLSQKQAIETVFYSLSNQIGGEIFIPICKKMNIMDLANVMCESCEKSFIGLRSGEKLHEELLTSEEKKRSIINENYIIVSSTETQNTDFSFLHECYNQDEIRLLLKY